MPPAPLEGILPGRRRSVAPRRHGAREGEGENEDELHGIEMKLKTPYPPDISWRVDLMANGSTKQPWLRLLLAGFSGAPEAILCSRSSTISCPNGAYLI